MVWRGELARRCGEQSWWCWVIIVCVMTTCAEVLVVRAMAMGVLCVRMSVCAGV